MTRPSPVSHTQRVLLNLCGTSSLLDGSRPLPYLLKTTLNGRSRYFLRTVGGCKDVLATKTFS